ncbi:MAG TPA: NUDIX hydrolase [Candidatus Binatia bacterium]|nr:NUDIX hydrolase [Candidatus Binatia bacterium]
MSETAAPTGDAVRLIEAASVILLRDGPSGLETFAVVRHRKSSTFAGMLVFPGGQVDAADASAAIHARCADLAPAEAARRLALAPPERAMAQYVAGLRELFEEAGVLLARRDGRWIDPGGLGDHDLSRVRAALHGAETDLAALCEELSLELAPGELDFFAHWITPEGIPTRFDTRFFLAPLPPSQEARHDGRETSAGEWLTPADALARYRRGEAQLVPPTFMLLSELSQLGDVASARAAARTRDVMTILPRCYSEESGPAFLYPGDVAYEGGDPARPGPRRRLVTRDGLFREVAED